MSPAALAESLKAEAARLGFVLAGVAPAVSPPGFARFGDWLDAGYAGQMAYLAARREAYEHPRRVLDGVRSVVMLAWPYRTVEPAPLESGQARISRYAWGRDYHDVIHDRLQELSAWLVAAAPGSRVRGVVDSAPLLEREFAQLAGLGWIGKNTLLLNRQWGSWFFLAALLTDVELPCDEPFEADHCGTCRACLDACPTGAFVDAYVLDARACLSYLMIELREPVPLAWRASFDEWLFGCDVCQDVCPWNHKAPTVDEPAQLPAPGANPANLAELFALDDAAFRARFRETPLWRAKRRGLLRNAALVLGNRGDESAIAPLEAGLRDAEALVRGASAWALGRLAQRGLAVDAIRNVLAARLAIEPDPSVREEINESLP